MGLVGFLVLVGWIFLILFVAGIVSSRVKFRSKSHVDDANRDD